MQQDFNMTEQKKKRSPLKTALLCAACVVIAAALFFAGFFVCSLSQDEGLRSLLWFKDRIQESYYKDISDEKFWEAAIGGVEGLLDDYSCYYSADEYDAEVNADRGIMDGTGLAFFTDTNKIYKVAVGSPAFYAEDGEGRRAEAGMYLTGVGTAEGEMKDTFTAAALEKALSSVSAGDTCVLRLSAGSASETDDCLYLSVTFGTYTESFVLYATNEGTYAEIFENGSGSGVWQKVGGGMEELKDGQAYIRLVQFSGNAAEEFAYAAAQYKEDGCETLLLDLRNNGGGSLSVLRGIAPYLMQGDRERFVVMYAGEGTAYYAEGNEYAEYFADSRIYVAANRNTASASEALMGAMLHYGSIGYSDIYLVKAGGKEDDPARTYGKGIMQTTYYNPLTGEAAKLTTARIYWPDKTTCVQGRGITSDDGAHRIDAASNADYGDPALSEILNSIG